MPASVVSFKRYAFEVLCSQLMIGCTIRNGVAQYIASDSPTNVITNKLASAGCNRSREGSIAKKGLDLLDGVITRFVGLRS